MFIQCTSKTSRINVCKIYTYFCGLLYFCLKNNQQTCEKQISGLKFCAEFMRNNGLRLERG